MRLVRLKHYKINVGWILFAALSILPVALWSMHSAGKLSSLSGIMNSLGQITGLVGMAMFSLTLVLAARMKVVENLFSGLDKVYGAHKAFGSFSFMLILFHPLLLAVKYMQVSLSGAAFFLLPGSDFAVNAGFVALLGMMSLLIGTFFIRLQYHNWKLLHRFMGIFFAFAAIHTFLVPSDISRILALRIYMASVVSLGIVACAYRMFAGIFVGKFNYIVGEVRKLSGDVIEIEMFPENDRMEFLPGQFIFVSFRNGGVSSETHPFSISSSPFEDTLRLSIKSLGDYTSKLHGLRKGASARIEGPFGKLCLGEKCESSVWIAGGIGITPFLSMARSLDSVKEHGVDLFYCAKNEDEAVFVKELEAISSKNRNFRLVPHYSEKQGRITVEAIERISGGLTRKRIILCGPPPMMNGLKDQLLKLGVPAGNIHYESFQFL